METERRSHPRVKVSHPTLYFSNISSRPTVATTVDLSTGGTRIETFDSLISGERLQISIAIRPQVIRCRATVVHILRLPNGRRFEAGIRFDDMSLEDRSYLRKHLSSAMEQ